MKIERVKKPTRRDLEDINRLIPELSSSAHRLSYRDLKRVVTDSNIRFFVLRDRRKIVGYGFLVFILTAVGLRARIEDVVVSSGFRGAGLGTLLMRCMILEAKKRRARWVDLTSRRDRTGSEEFYKKLGFRVRDTRVYRLSFEHGRKKS